MLSDEAIKAHREVDGNRSYVLSIKEQVPQVNNQ